MDVVYPLGSSTWGQTEIKYSIRSLFKHSIEPFEKIFIVGEKPEFFEYSDRLIHIPFKETQSKEVNIWEKILTASNDNRVSEEFFFMNDDFFFVENFVMSTFPNFHKGNFKEIPWTNYNLASLTGYRKKAVTTYKLLRKLKLPTWHFDIHCPKRLEKEKFIQAYNYFKPHLYKGTGLIMLSTYGNYHRLEPTVRGDVKIGNLGLKQFIKGPKNLLFSTYDEAKGWELLNYFNTIYPEKSPIEK